MGRPWNSKLQNALLGTCVYGYNVLAYQISGPSEAFTVYGSPKSGWLGKVGNQPEGVKMITLFKVL